MGSPCSSTIARRPLPHLRPEVDGRYFCSFTSTRRSLRQPSSSRPVASSSPREVSRIEFVTIRVAGIGRVEKAKLEPLTTGGPAAAAQIGSRSAWFEGGRLETAIYDRALLGAGAELAGPAIVQQADSTTVVPPGASARVDAYGNIVVTV